MDGSVDMAGSVGPLASLNIKPSADKTDGRPPFVDFHQRALGLVVENGTMSYPSERAELDHQRSRFGWIRYVAAHFPGLQIDIAIRQTRRRIKHRQQTVS